MKTILSIASLVISQFSSPTAWAADALKCRLYAFHHPSYAFELENQKDGSYAAVVETEEGPVKVNLSKTNATANAWTLALEAAPKDPAWNGMVFKSENKVEMPSDYYLQATVSARLNPKTLFIDWVQCPIP